MAGESRAARVAEVPPKPRVGISACLLGESVRFDGGHKHDRYLTDTLGLYFDWVPVCPEVECGLPTPRESMHLEGDPESPRLVTTRTHEDKTEQERSWARRRVEELANEDLCGFIFKKDSPSSGMRNVRVYDENGVPRKVGVGIFSRIFMDRFPLLPVEEEGRLHDPHLRESFIERIFCLKRYRDFLASDGGVGGLVEFHTDHKMLIMAHHVEAYRQLGRLVAHARELPRDELFARYEQLMLRALSTRATPRKNANVLMHMMGYLKEQLSADEKQEMLQLIDRYKGEIVPLIVPATLMNHYVRKYGEAYLARQWYLHPHPVELQLRNHA